MPALKNRVATTFSITFALAASVTIAAERWTPQQANDWYKAQPWLVGCDYIPSTAINQLEMWQPETFDPATIDRELGWAESLGFNTVRVFLHDLPWKENRETFHKNVDKFLDIAARHNIRPMLVFFDGVWDPDPQSGPQNRPRRGVHNSGWVQSPGRVILADNAKQDALKPYVSDIVSRYGKDKRVLAWDLFNEPDNLNGNSYGPLELKNKDAVAARLVRLSFDWAREAGPTQPLTVCLWNGNAWDVPEKLDQVHRAAVELSDVISFHDYSKPDVMQSRIQQLRKYGRPLICTEFMARGNGSTFEAILPILKKEKVAAYSWGLVDGKTQTKYPWATWQMPIIGDPDPWHHDIFHTDGRPYRAEEAKFIRELIKHD
ncbi:MAG TPA: cellulase family glycosylhydrolase [Lacipirellulaceae bacterium]|nr:cellulase family glycosylhydrolase [Lacipirellulaceae bacterium]